MKCYKGFDKDMKCRGFQYEEGKTYEEEKAELCNTGFHACEDPLDIFGYYPPADSKYHEVELEEITEERSKEDTKICGRRITIGAEIGIPGIVKAHVEYVKANVKKAVEAGDAKAVAVGDEEAASAGYRGSASAGDSGSASAGYRGSASAGYRGSASAGYRGSASAGDSGSASAGYSGSASAGYSGSASAGDSGSASAGDRGSASAGYSGSASAGYRGSASAGDSGSASSFGKSSVGKNGCAIARGNGAMVRGGIGAVLVLVEENAFDCGIRFWKSEEVDGERIKESTWYRLDSYGEFKEVEE